MTGLVVRLSGSVQKVGRLLQDRCGNLYLIMALAFSDMVLPKKKLLHFHKSIHASMGISQPFLLGMENPRWRQAAESTDSLSSDALEQTEGTASAVSLEIQALQAGWRESHETSV